MTTHNQPETNLARTIIALGSISRHNGVNGEQTTSADCTGVSVNPSTGTILNPVAYPTIERRPLPQPMPFDTHCVGREHELNLIEAEIRPESGVWLRGPSGSGITTLLEQAIDSKAAQQLPDGIIYVQGEIEPAFLEDIIQRLFGRFFTSSATVHLTPDLAQTYLGSLKALFALDQLALDQDALVDLTDILVDSAILVAADGPAPDTLLDLPINGLPRQEAIKFCAEVAGLDSERPQTTALLERLCHALEDLPLPLLLVGQLIRTGAASLEMLVGRLEELAGYSPERATEWDIPFSNRETLTASELTGECEALELAAYCCIITPNETERAVLAALARIGGHDADLAALTATTLLQIDTIETALARLIDLRLVKKQGERHAISTLTLRNALDRLLRPGPERTRAAAYFAVSASLRVGDLDWLEQERGNLLAAIQTSLAEEQPAQAGALIQTIQPLLVLRGLWSTWAQIIDWAFHAAQMSGDRRLHAWALHEYGTRAGVTDDRAGAVAQLNQAYQLRTQLGDEPGAAASHHNLAHLGLLAQPEPVRGPKRTTPRWAMPALVLLPLLLVIGVFTANTFLQSLPTALRAEAAYSTPNPTQTPTLTPTSAPTQTAAPTAKAKQTSKPSPTNKPTATPTRVPSQPAPVVVQPVNQASAPIIVPTDAPAATTAPTTQPSESSPTPSEPEPTATTPPTMSPTSATVETATTTTAAPTTAPAETTTTAPTTEPTAVSTIAATIVPAASPTIAPVEAAPTEKVES